MGTPSIWPPAPATASVEHVVVDRDVSIPMSDGARIVADVYRPADAGPHPALFAISPYQKDLAHLPPIPVFRWRESGDIDWWVRHGYVFVHADSRGAGKSLPGDWRVLDAREQEDLHDAIEWIAEQPWCTGRVGMTGESYYAVVQWLAAAQQPRHLACIAPYDGWIDPYRDLFFHGGMPTMGFTTWWLWDVRARMLLDRPGPHDRDVMRYDFIDDLLRHPCDDAFWSERSAHEKLDRIQVPVYSMSNWTMVGIHLRANLIAYEELAVPKKLLVGSGEIGGDSQRFYHSEALHTELLRFFDHWLKDVDNDVMDEAPIKLFVRNGEGFRDEHEWPLARTEWTPIYLQPGPTGTATSRNDGALAWEPPVRSTPPTTYAYPDERWGGWPILGPAARGLDGQIDRLANILTFTSEPVTQPLEVTGPIVAKLWLSSDQLDTDLVVSLMDVVADGGPPRRVTRGWLRASHRAIEPSRSRPYRPFHDHRCVEPLRPGEVYELEVEIWPTSWVFHPGHRIRIEVSNADSPMFDNPINHHYGVKVGCDSIHHDAEHPSHVVLPVIPAAT